MNIKPLFLIAMCTLACGSSEAPAPTAEAQALVASNSCNGFQPDHCGSCADTLPFKEALQVTIPWCTVGLCPPGREPWFCNPTFQGPPIMCSLVTGSQPHKMAAYCCDPVAANQQCGNDSDCGVMSAECYQSKCVQGACIVEQKPDGTACPSGICKVFEPGRPMVCGPDTI